MKVSYRSRQLAIMAGALQQIQWNDHFCKLMIVKEKCWLNMLRHKVYCTKAWEILLDLINMANAPMQEAKIVKTIVAN